jgi:hypothetical protein
VNSSPYLLPALMGNAQLCGKFVIPLRFSLMAKHLIGMSQIQVERWIEVLNSAVVDGLGSVQRLLIPSKYFLGFLLISSNIVRGHTSIKVIPGCFPCLHRESTGILNSPFEFSPCPFNAEFYHRIVEVHTLPHSFAAKCQACLPPTT